jgi:hypothetical protein
MASPLVQALSFQNSAHPSQSAISPTDVIGAYNLAANVAQKNYEAKLAQQNAKFGGMAQLGGAGILAGGPTAYNKLFGAGIPPGTPTAASSTTAAAPEQFSSVFGNGATAANAAPTVAADYTAASSPIGILGDAGATGAGAGEVAADIAAATPAAASAGDALAAGGAAAGAGGLGDALASLGLPDWLASVLPFLAAAPVGV